MFAISIDLLRGCGYHRYSYRRMPPMGVLAGVIWHYWLAVPLAVGGVALTVATLVGYFQKVSSTRYPTR